MLKSFFCLTASLLAVGQVLSFSAAAQVTTDRQYAIVRTYAPAIGANFSAANVTLNSGWSRAEACRSLTKEMWMSFNTPVSSVTGNKDWLEVGRKHGRLPTYPDEPTPIDRGTCGNTPVSFYDAYFTARMLTDSSGVQRYRAWAIVGPSTTGTHNYQIKKPNADSWAIYIDRVVRLTHTDWPYSAAADTTVGWETSSNVATWASPNYSTDHQVLLSDGKFYYWSNGERFNVNTFGLNWVASFYNTTPTAYSQAKYVR